jgi:hypothetical protein
VYYFRNGGKAGERLFDEGGFPSPEKTIERLRKVGSTAMSHNRSSDMWPAHGTARRLL